MSTLERTCAIVVAAGESRRMNGIDKVLVTLDGRPLLAWSIEVLQKSPLIEHTIIVTSERNLQAVRRLTEENGWSKVIEVCVGGKRRQDSVTAGLAHAGNCDYVLIHDGARPFLTDDLIERGIAAARVTGAAIAAVPVTDTIKKVSADGVVLETPLRESLWMVQTPQVFRLTLIREAYSEARGDVTDDASLVEQLGSRVKVYMGAYDNIKITSPADLQVAACLAPGMKHHG